MPPLMPDGQPWPRVSIVTPSYNQAQFLEETIRSVLLQGYPGLEYIIIDGGSTDGSVDIIRQYAPWLAYWVSEPDRGQSHAINKGFERATGDVVAWLNSDDVYLPATLEKVAYSFESNLDAGVVHGALQIIDELGQVMDVWPAERFTWQGQMPENRLWQPAVFMRRRALHRAGPVDESLHYAMDYDLWLRIALVCPMHPIDSTLACFRLWQGSKTSQYQAAFWMEIIGIINRFYARTDIPPEARSIEAAVCARAHWKTGLLLEDAGESMPAQAHLNLAVSDQRFVDSEANTMINELLYWPQQPRSSGDLHRIVTGFPSTSKHIRPFIRKLWARYHGACCFEARSACQASAARNHAVYAIWHDPSWLKNRGFLRIVVWSFIQIPVMQDHS